MARDGSVLLGSKASSITAIDPDTGALIRTVTAGPSGLPAALDLIESESFHPDPLEDEPGPQMPLIYFGRSYYEVRSLDVATGSQRWNVTFGELRGLGLAAKDGRTLPLEEPARGGGAGTLTVGPGLSVRWTEPGPERAPRWTVRLPSPLMHAYYHAEEGGLEGPAMRPVEIVYAGDRTAEELVLGVAAAQASPRPPPLPSGWAGALSMSGPGCEEDGPASLSGLSCPMLPPLVREFLPTLFILLIISWFKRWDLVL